jgi:hypothetical protein
VENIESAAESFDRFGEITGAALEKRIPVGGADDLARPFQRQSRSERFPDGAQLAPDPQDRGQTRFEVEVAGAFRFSQGNEGAQSHGFFTILY